VAFSVVAHGEDFAVRAGRLAVAWERYAWGGGVLFVLALVAEAIVSVAIKANQNDSAAKIARELQIHHQRSVVIACISMLYAIGFVVYLARLDELLRGVPNRPPALASLVLIGGVLFVALHAVSDIGITGMLGAKVAAYSAQHDPGLSYTLYLLTFALDSVGDVFGSLFFVAAGVLLLGSRELPHWLAWAAVAAGVLLFLQGFGLGGVISDFGLFLDLVGFLLLLIFVLASSVILLFRRRVVAAA
jgi:hypothetical protein